MTISQANMRLSAVDGTAFIDFSAENLLTANISKRLTVISKTTGKKLIGFIKAAGTAETLGDEKFSDPTLSSVSLAAAKTVVGITKANPGVVTFAAGHGYINGSTVYFSGLTQMTELNGQYWQLREASGDTFQLSTANWGATSLDTSGYGAAETTGGACVQHVKSTVYNIAGYLNWNWETDGAGALTGNIISNGTVNNQYFAEPRSATSGQLLKLSAVIDDYVSGTYKQTMLASGVNGPELSSGGTKVLYGTSTGTNDQNGLYIISAAKLIVSTMSFKQALTPSATGVTIVSTPGGATYNWESKEAGFNYNDPAGYEYLITNQRAIFTNHYRQMRAA